MTNDLWSRALLTFHRLVEVGIFKSHGQLCRTKNSGMTDMRAIDDTQQTMRNGPWLWRAYVLLCYRYAADDINKCSTVERYILYGTKGTVLKGVKYVMMSAITIFNHHTFKSDVGTFCTYVRCKTNTNSQSASSSLN
jgi:hypothetical protein